MSIVDVVHPAPMRVVRTGCRSEDLMHARMVTPATLRDVSAAEVPQVGEVAVTRWVRRPVHAFEGRLWHPVRRSDALPAVIEAWEFELWLDSDHDFFSTADTAHRQFRGTPVAAEVTYGGRRMSRGLKDIDARLVIEDGRDRAEQDVRRYLQDEILLVGGTVFARSRGPLAHLAPGPVSTGFEAWLYDPHDAGTLPCRLDRIVDFVALYGTGIQGDWKHSQAFWAGELVGPSASEFPWHLTGDEESRAFVGRATTDILGDVARAVRNRGMHVLQDHGLPEIVGRVRHYRALASVGAIQPEDVGPAFQTLRDLLATLHANIPEARSSRALARWERHIRDFAHPGFLAQQGAPHLGQADQDALAGLGDWSGDDTAPRLG